MNIKKLEGMKACTVHSPTLYLEKSNLNLPLIRLVTDVECGEVQTICVSRNKLIEELGGIMPPKIPYISGAKTIADYENLKNQCAIKIKELAFPADKVVSGSWWRVNDVAVLIVGSSYSWYTLQTANSKEGGWDNSYPGAGETLASIEKWIRERNGVYLGMLQVPS